MHPGVALQVTGATNAALKTLRVGDSTGSDMYNVPYTVTVVGAGSYMSVQPWNWAADVNSAGQVRPCPSQLSRTPAANASALASHVPASALPGAAQQLHCQASAHAVNNKRGYLPPSAQHDVAGAGLTPLVGRQITGPVSADWEALQMNGTNTVNIGTIAFASSAAALTPVSVSVNGAACALTVVPNPTET